MRTKEKQVGRQRISLFVKLIASFMLLLIIPVNIISIAAHYNALNYFRNEIANTNIQKLLATQGLVETIMNGIVRDAKNIGLNKTIDTIGRSEYYDGGSSNAELKNAEEIINILYNAKISNDFIRSIYLYDRNSGKVYSSERVCIDFDKFYDNGWIAKAKNVNRGMIWLDTRDSGIPVTDENSARNSLTGQRKVVTLVYPIGYISSMDGVIAINVLEEKLSRTLAESAMSEMDEIMIINSAGTIITDSVDGMAGKDLSDQSYIREILNSAKEYGYVTANIGNAEYLVTYAGSGLNGWIYINKYPFERVLSRVNTFRNFTFIISFIMTLLGIPLCLFISKRLYNPVKKLVDDIKAQKGISSFQGKNEMAVISEALEDVLKQGSQIRSLIERNQKNFAENYILSLLRGETPENEVPYVQFAKAIYMCAIIAIDNYSSFAEKHSDEGRYYIKEIVLKVCENMINTCWKCYGVQYEKGKIALIINADENQEKALISEIEAFFADIKKKVYEVLDNTITIAIGRCYRGRENVEKSFTEAKEMLKYRLLHGGDRILPIWKVANDISGAYYYPASMENYIFNYLKLGMKKELAESVSDFIKEIRSMNLSYDNVIQIINQLIGDIIKYMINARINPSDIFPGGTTMYQQVASMETLDEIMVWLVGILNSVIDYIEIRDRSQNKYIRQIQSFIQKNYRNEINFEELAASVGISYSHMRKLFRDELGTSVLDYVNSVRVENAKRLLKGTDYTLSEISARVGFQNIQSFNRFFKKFEGISPSEFRRI